MYMAHYVEYAMPWIGNFAQEMNSMLNEITGMVTSVPAVSNDDT